MSGKTKMAQVLEPRGHIGEREKAPDSRLEFGLALAIMAIWRVNQWTEALSVSPCCNSAFQVIKINLKESIIQLLAVMLSFLVAVFEK